MQDHTRTGIRHPSSMRTQHLAISKMYLCNMDQCERAAADEVGIALCERHLQKAWAAYQIIQGRTPPAEGTDQERDVLSLDARGTVYVFRVQDMIKIGWTSNPNRRASQLKADAVLYFRAGTKRDERRLHELCADHLVKGKEWFDTSVWMARFVQELHQGKHAA